MGRTCAECQYHLVRADFSNNQWRKGPGCSRCVNCVNNDYGYSYICHQCNRSFNSQNELNMHMQVHRPRTVACPVCGETRFRSGANAVQHVESGFCTGCRGADNARRQIYDYACRQRAMQPFLTERPLLTNGGGTYDDVPDLPYHCPQCMKSFRHLSQLLQHQDQKHNNARMLGY